MRGFLFRVTGTVLPWEKAVRQIVPDIITTERQEALPGLIQQIMETGKEFQENPGIILYKEGPAEREVKIM